ncbi:hypothetical protein [Natronococcus occultus]|uniref:Uncharacterized protein n=1 Tax=Natronococcus occultus SP4 TaxID=694430 RepID=L0K2Y7_9EURY|nr:hypothetical protein [Natronococcus occultus]AGB39351.1 hypothetical protein Natoc_3635 [Natronococcus occultus SP4]
MKGPENYDDGYYQQLGPQDKADFEKLFRKKANTIDEDRARESYEQSFQSNFEEEYRLFRDVVNAFSSGKAGFEATIVDPLYEFGDTNAEVLLAKPQSNTVHLCFVSCRVGGHNYTDWMAGVNETYRLANNTEMVEDLKTHINCTGLNLGTVQYVTLTRDIDIPDADVNILKSGADPEYYAIWKLIRSAEYNEKEEKMEEAKTIKYHDGTMSVPDFQNICQQGIDPKAAENDDIKYSLTLHSVFPLGEVCLDLYLDKLGDEENPKEFYEEEFEEAFLDNVYFGNDRGAMTSIAEDKVDTLLNFGLEHGVLKENSDIVDERDYKIMWGSEDPGAIKSMVREKFIDSKVPDETGEMAFSRAKEDFEESEHSLDDFDED